MPEMSPSKRKMIVAKKFAKELYKRTGDNLRTVLAVGSVAAGMVKLDSDIDLIAVCKDSGAVSKHDPALSYEFYDKTKEKIVMASVNEMDFKSHGRHDTKKILSIMRLFDGAVPVFGKEYALKHKNCWRYPNLKTIKRRYSPPIARPPEPGQLERLMLKRGKGRFLRP
ncbi:MAG: hypothetical protein HYW05_00720 [Candidatus Diapherotrites archaeon]|nr:hypothetical protein [Candidatus Diapherotrites archaeon]